MGLLRDSNHEIYGAESIWFWLLVERGVLGVFSYCFIFYTILVKTRTFNAKFLIMCITIYWLLLQTMTTTYGIGIYYYIVVILIIYKSEILFRRSLRAKTISREAKLRS